jgi:hypothetical protein
VTVVWLAPSDSCTAVACAGADVGGGATVVDDGGETGVVDVVVDVVGAGPVVVDDASVVVSGTGSVVDAARCAELPHPASAARGTATTRVHDAARAARPRMVLPLAASPTTGSPYGAGRPSRARDSTRASSA